MCVNSSRLFESIPNLEKFMIGMKKRMRYNERIKQM